MEVAKLRGGRASSGHELVASHFRPLPTRARHAAHPLPDLRLVLARHDVFNNVIRTTIEAMAAILRAARNRCTPIQLDEALPPCRRFFRPHRPQHAAGLGAGIRHPAQRRPVGRIVHRGAAHRRPRRRAREHIAEVEALGGMARALESGLPQQRIEEAAARTQARIDSGRQVVVGVNRYRSDDLAEIEVLKVDNASVRGEQIEKLQRLRSERDPAAVRSALAALTAAAGGIGNLLAHAVPAARAGATVGEMSAALEQAFGRYSAEPKTLSGIYGREVETEAGTAARVAAMAAEFERNEGRRPRILVAKVGQDGHDRGQKVIASGFADLGFSVDVGRLFARQRRPQPRRSE
jgi:methylmalonyl-CoA mutase